VNKRYSILLIFIVFLGFLLRSSFRGETLVENDAILFTEAVKIARCIKPWPSYTACWAPFFLSGWYGWLLPNLRALLYLVFPSLKVQYFLTVIFGLLVIISTARFAARVYDNKKITLFSAFLVSIIPIQVSMSYGISAEIPATFFMLEAFNFLFDWKKNKKKSYFFTSAIFLSCAMLSKPIGFLAIPGIIFTFVTEEHRGNSKIISKILLYFFISLLIWSTWLIPNSKKFISDMPHSFSSFMLKVGSETMREGLVLTHTRFLSRYGIILLLFSLLHLLYSRKVPDIFILFFISSSLLLLHLFKDVMSYWYPFIIPFYATAISKSAIFLKKIIIKLPYTLLLVYFVFLCLKSNLLNIHFDYSSQYGYLARADNKYMEMMITCQGILQTIDEINRLTGEHDNLYVMHNYISYKGLFLDKKATVLPVYAYVKDGQIVYNENWGEEVDGMTKFNLHGTTYVVVQDGAYYYRVYDKGIWRQTNLCKILESKGFRKIYENHYPDESVLKKCKRFYRCCLDNQWVRNYIYRR